MSADDGAVHLRKPRLHDEVLRRKTKQRIAAIETEGRSRVFTWSHDLARRTTTAPPRGMRYPRASALLAPEHKAFAWALSPVPLEEPRAPIHPEEKKATTKHDLQNMI